MNIENYIEMQYREFNNEFDKEYIDLYSFTAHDKLKIIFSTLHAKLNILLNTMNDRLPTDYDTAHFWADPSRELIRMIEIVENLEKTLKSTEYSFSIDDYYKSIFSVCKGFLSKSGGSTIPPGINKIEIYYLIPIFIDSESINPTNQNDVYYKLHPIGSGSYAKVYKYLDSFYDKEIAVKRANKDLSEKEIIRFKREFIEMKNLKSPYVVEVFCYNNEKNEYFMEMMDLTLYDYIIRNNVGLSIVERKNIVNQVLKAFIYISSKGLLHRDISPKNILIKKYEDVIVVKISDFGLVKTNDSQLTSRNTELKGYFNDPALVSEGFNQYSILHETYSLTRLLVFILTGKTNLEKIKDKNLLSFIEKGLHPDKTKRFKSIDDLRKNVKTMLDSWLLLEKI